MEPEASRQEQAKEIGEEPAMLSNLAYSNTVENTNLSEQQPVSNQQAMNDLGLSLHGDGTETV